MVRSDVITLLSTAHTQDIYGVSHETTVSRDVLCKVDSVTRQEYFEAGRNGLNPSFRFTVFMGDYNGERIVIFHGQPYAVYRSYLDDSNRVELYVERKGGTNGKESTS